MLDDGGAPDRRQGARRAAEPRPPGGADGRLPVVLFCAGGIATPADASLVMQLGAEGVFVGSGIFKSEDPSRRANAIVEATTHYARSRSRRGGVDRARAADDRASRPRSSRPSSCWPRAAGNERPVASTTTFERPPAAPARASGRWPASPERAAPSHPAVLECSCTSSARRVLRPRQASAGDPSRCRRTYERDHWCRLSGSASSRSRVISKRTRRIVRALGAEPREVRTAADLEGLDALIIPGGESTVMTLGIEREGFAEPLRSCAAPARRCSAPAPA